MKEKKIHGYTIRQAKEEDLSRIAEIIKNCWAIGIDYERERMFGKVNNKSWDEWKVPEQIGFLRKNSKNIIVQVTEAFEIVGFASWIIHKGRNIGEVTANAIDPRHAGKGLGYLQLQYVLEQLKKAGVAWIEVETGLNDGHIPARKMYEKAGFKPLFKSIRYAMKIERGKHESIRK